MNHYDIEKIYDELETYLIKNIKKNLTSDLTSFHLKEEKAYGFDWEAWQTAKLKELKRYRRQNKTIVNKRLANIDSQIAEVLQRENRQGKLDAFKNFRAALTHGYKSSVAVKDSFFKLNDKKVNKLINAVKNDFKTANRAVLRKSNDVYRQIIFEASMYNQTGVMTEQQAIKKAISDFEKRGINCIEYSNGSRHKISDYSKMAIRTASTRAYLHGEGEFRKEIGETLVLMSKHNTACKLCQPWEGKVLIDDVYSGGTKKDGRYHLLSEAMKQGLYHPNCRHGHGTYYKELGKKTSNKIIEELEEKPPINEYEATHVSTSENIINIFKKGFQKTKMGYGIFGKGVYASTDKNVIDYYKSAMDNSLGMNVVYDTTDYANLTLEGIQHSEEELFNNLMNQLDKEIRNEYEELLSTRRKSPYKYRNAFLETLQNNGYKGMKITQDLSMIDEVYYKKNKLLIEKINNTYIDPLVGGSQIVGWDLSTIKIKRK